MTIATHRLQLRVILGGHRGRLVVIRARTRSRGDRWQVNDGRVCRVIAPIRDVALPDLEQSRLDRLDLLYRHAQ